MYEFINRFIDRFGQEQIMTRLFGTDEWKSLDLNCAPELRREIIHDFYQLQLETRAAKYVRSFQMRGRRNATKYFLFYGTNHKRGLQRMKEAMWKVDGSGSYTFSDTTDRNQTVMFETNPDYNHLKKLIITEFSGKKVRIEEVEDYVLCKTPFLTTHIKRQILNPMEKTRELVVLESNRKNKGTYPEGTLIQFRPHAAGAAPSDDENRGRAV